MPASPRGEALFRCARIGPCFYHQSHPQLGIFLPWLHPFILSGIICLGQPANPGKELTPQNILGYGVEMRAHTLFSLSLENWFYAARLCPTCHHGSTAGQQLACKQKCVVALLGPDSDCASCECLLRGAMHQRRLTISGS